MVPKYDLIPYLRKERIENEAFKYKDVITIDLTFNSLNPEVTKWEMENLYFQQNLVKKLVGLDDEDFWVLYRGLGYDMVTHVYYQRRVSSAPGEPETFEYRRINLGDNSWTTLSEAELSEFVQIDVRKMGSIYYDRKTTNLLLVPLDPVIVSGSFFYDPRHLGRYESGQEYEIEFVDHKGNSTRFWDRYRKWVVLGLGSIEPVDRTYKLIFHHESGYVHWYPRINNGGVFDNLSVSYYYVDYFDIHPNTISEVNSNMALSIFNFRGNLGPKAIELKFNSIYGLLTFLNETVLREDFDFDVNKKAKSYSLEQWFVNDYVDLVKDEFNRRRSNIDELFELFYYIPEHILKEFPSYILWEFLATACQSKITNFGIDKEDIVLHVLGALSIKEKSKVFLDQLLKPIRKSSHILELLIYRLHSDSYTQLVYLIWSVWAKSSYFSFDPSNAALPKKENNPLLIPYKSDTKLSFHRDNAKIYWKDAYTKIEVDFELPKIVQDLSGDFEELKDKFLEDYDRSEMNNIPYIEGKAEKEKRNVPETYEYHPFCPILIVNKENPKFIFKGGGDEKDYATIMPAFVLLASEERAFWSNLMTLTEYLIDILSLAGGLGIFLKVGRFAMAVSTGDSILLQGIKKGVNYGGASIFITSGVGRGLLKLTETRDTPLGRAISEVLFYLEMAAIVGYVGVGVHAFIQRSAQKALTYTDDIEKIYREVDELTKKNTDKFDNVTKTDELVAAEERLAAVKKLEEIAGGASKIDDLGSRITQQELKVIDDAMKKLGITSKIPKNSLNSADSLKRMEKIYDTLKTMKKSNKFNPKKNKLLEKGLNIPLSKNGVTANYEGTSFLFKTMGNEKNIVRIKLTGNRAHDNKLAFELSGIKPTDDILNNYVWHHMNDFDPNTGTCVMQLVEDSVHTFSKPHYGATSLVDYYFQKAIYSKRLSLNI
jgi:hypothetical protein